MRLMFFIAILLSMSVAHAQDRDAAPAVNPLANSSDFLAYHPDLGDRKLGMEAFKRGSFDYAARYFQWAARYADKPSQAMLGSMYWSGQGVKQDRALAYAWMDLAAERGYPSLLAFRERYWQEMNEQERKRAIEVGQPLYTEYGDAAAKPRLAIMLRRGLHEVTGSHTGFVGTMEIHIPGPGGNPIIIDANQYYDPHFWKEKQYWTWADKAWKAAPTGVVNIGVLEVLPDEKKPASLPPADPAQSDKGKR